MQIKAMPFSFVALTLAFLGAPSVALAACGPNYQSMYNRQVGKYECIKLSRSQQLKSQTNKRQQRLNQKTKNRQLQLRRTQRKVLIKQQQNQRRQNAELQAKQRQLLEGQRTNIVDDVNNERRKQSKRRQELTRLQARELKRQYDLQKLLDGRETLETKQDARRLKTLKRINSP